MRTATDEALEALLQRFDRHARSIRAALDRIDLELTSIRNHIQFLERFTVASEDAERTP